MSESHKTLYLAYRPQGFDDLEGQEHIKETLKNAAKLDKLSHAYLFSGPRGTGKTSTARILAKAMNCLHLAQDGNPCGTCEICKDIEQGFMVDVIEIDAASHRSIDDIRDLREKVRFSPTIAKRKVYIIDEVHMLTKDAFNALLKTLEEPPSHVYFILATTELHKVLPTIISRCQLFQFYGLTDQELIDRMEYICKKEGFTYELPALEIIARDAAGGARDALSLLEKVAFQNEPITVELVSTLLGKGSKKLNDDLLLAIRESDSEQILSLLSHIERRGIPADNYMKGFLTYVRGMMMHEVFEEKNTSFLSFYTTLLQELETALLESKSCFLPFLPFEIRLTKTSLPTTQVVEVPQQKKEQPQIQMEKTQPVAAQVRAYSTPIKKNEPEAKEDMVQAAIPKDIPEVVTSTAKPTVSDEKIQSESQGSEHSIPLSTLKRDWDTITGKMKKSIARLTFGKHSFPRNLDGSQLTIAVFGKLHISKAEENKQELVETLKAQFHVDFFIQFVEEEKSPAPTTSVHKAVHSPMQTTPSAEDIAELMGGTIMS